MPSSEEEEQELQKDYRDYLKFIESKHQILLEQKNSRLNSHSQVGKSKNINSNTDFSGAGIHISVTKHVPYAVRKGFN